MCCRSEGFPEEGAVFLNGRHREGNVLWRTRRKNDTSRGHRRTGEGRCDGGFARVGTRKVGQSRRWLERVLVIHGAQILSVLVLGIHQRGRKRVLALVQVAVAAENEVVLVFAVYYNGHGEGRRDLLWLAVVRGERASERGETRDARRRGAGAHGTGRG